MHLNFKSSLHFSFTYSNNYLKADYVELHVPPKNILITLVFDWVSEVWSDHKTWNDLFIICFQKVFAIIKLVKCQIISQFCKYHLYDTLNMKYY